LRHDPDPFSIPTQRVVVHSVLARKADVLRGLESLLERVEEER
jgi:hypothetical protein